MGARRPFGMPVRRRDGGRARARRRSSPRQRSGAASPRRDRPRRPRPVTAAPGGAGALPFLREHRRVARPDQRRLVVDDPQPRLRSAPQDLAQRHPARRARPARRAAPGRRQGRPALPARLRRRPRHRRRHLRRRRAGQPAVARARPGLRRSALAHPRGDRAHRRRQGPLRRALRRLLDGRRGQPDHPRPVRSSRACSTPSACSRRSIAALVAGGRFVGIASPSLPGWAAKLHPWVAFEAAYDQGPFGNAGAALPLQPLRQAELRPRPAHHRRHVLPGLRLGLDRLGTDPRARGRRRPAVAASAPWIRRRAASPSGRC